MRTLLYSLLVIFIIQFFSCKSIDKLVEQGRYDEAIVLATKKLAGKKNKKTSHIMALEKAFARVNDHDKKHIEYLKSSGDPSAWERIYDYLIDIDTRQHRVMPFLPIVSKEGYVGHFELIDTRSLKDEAATHAADYRYEIGKMWLEKAMLNDDVLAAREAFLNLTVSNNYVKGYQDVPTLLDKSYQLGLIYVYIKWDGVGEPMSYQPRLILNLSESQEWTEYHFELKDEISYDFIATLKVEHIDISPEHELVNNFSERKEVERWEEAIDRNGNVAVDSSGQTIEVKVIDVYEAEITEIRRSKHADFRGTVEITNFVNGSLVDRKEFGHRIDFLSNACTFRGDRRALSDRWRKQINQNILNFPTDHAMVSEGIDNLFYDFKRYLSKCQFSNYFINDLVVK